ncbi:HEPN domain-containing protein [Frigoribacterium sp. VKM Ac-2530]|uniref:ApeA N-terminal domain 1-containing protein n=1 Tax=Frigoribacterium sp. VKM Ac-2530 TaxID=2783822 RepID=UPI00188A9C4F|nr:HEPN domain-containing protein [Frigoribacterium sp. VKM Ac-2530]MBF4580378.1 hypothetical protein [Frigoribacterium sp. VKM Ac-2530]
MAKGKFWNPGSPTDSYAGRLTSKKGTPWLKLTARVDDVRLGESFHAAEVILGETTKGEALTLWHTDPANNFLFNEKQRGEEHLSHEQQFAYLIRGAHIASPGDKLFRQSTVSFWDLAAWVRHPDVVPFDQETPPPFEPAIIPSVYDTGADVRVTIENAAYVERQHDGRECYRRFLGTDARVVFTFDEGQTLLTHQRLAFDLRALITYCYQRAASYTEQTLSFEPGSIKMPYSYHQDRKRTQQRTHHSQLALSPAELSPTTLLPRWWAGISDLYPIPQILAGRHYTRQAYMEGHVLAAVASAEKLYACLGLPEKRFDDSFFNPRKKEHSQLEKERKKTDASQEQQDFAALVSTGIKNEPTFDMKLHALVAHVGPDLMVAADIDTELWVKKVREVRNKLAHEGSHVDGISDSDAADWLGRVDDSTRVLLSLAVRQWLGAPRMETPRVRRIFRGRGVRLEPDEQPGTGEQADA